MAKEDKSVDAPAAEPAAEAPAAPTIGAASSTVASPSAPQEAKKFDKKRLGQTGVHTAPGGFTIETK
jgi:hypothetical protein